MTKTTRGRSLLMVAVAGCTVLWASIAIGGAVNEGYSHLRDYVSALSGRGSSAAFVGMLGLIGFSSAHAAAGLSYRGISRFAMAAWLAAAFAGVVVALARISCPDGAAMCSVGDDGPSDALDTLHGIGVVAYELCFLAGATATAVTLARASRTSKPQARGVAAALVALAVASAVTIVSTPESSPGGMQRLWLAINTSGVLLATYSGCRLLRRGSTP